MEEFEALRDEVVAWQERRFTVLTGAVTLVCVLLGFILSDAKNSWTRQQALTILFAVLGCASLVTWYAGRASTTRGAYLAVFYEQKAGPVHWETAIRELETIHPWAQSISLNAIMGFVFGAVAFAAASAVWAHCKPENNKVSTVSCYTAAAFLVLSLALSVFGASSMRSYKDDFRTIKEQFEKAPVRPPPDQLDKKAG
jgi:hypothetical protein